MNDSLGKTETKTKYLSQLYQQTSLLECNKYKFHVTKNAT